MKVRFSDHAVRCRVTRAELQLLVSGRPVELELALPRDHWFRINVRPAHLGSWQLDSDPTGLWLAIPQPQLQELALAAPSRDGLQQTFHTAAGQLTVSFEVDLKENR